MTNEQIIDINRTDISSMTMFHFQHSLRPFILTRCPDGEFCFVDLSIGESFRWSDLEFYDLYFYTKEDDPDFCGVAIIGEITY